MTSVLIVEGPGDQELFLSIFSQLGKTVTVDPPKARGYVSGNGISNVLKTLPVDLEKARSGAIEKMAVIVDADHSGVNGGFATRRKEILDILDSYQYDVSAVAPGANNLGEIFPHKNGLNPFGLWIMPNHFDDGSLEDFLAPLITSSNQQQIMAHGRSSLSALPSNLLQYNPVCHKSKAELSTWLAMQKPPGIPSDIAFRNGLFNQSQANFVALLSWINKVY